MKGHWEIIKRKMPHEAIFQPFDLIDHVTSSGPTCEDLGIPRDDACALSSSFDAGEKHQQRTKLRLNMISNQDTSPFSPGCIIPLPSPFGMGIFDAACFRRRNERERDRVRCVNDGYLKLKQHLPIENKDKRLSKVETLRYAIRYIKFLEDLLDNSENDDHSKRRTLSDNSDVIGGKMSRVPSDGNHVDVRLELSEDDFDSITDTSDYESKCDTSSEADISD